MTYFNDTYISVCVMHAEPFFFDLENCTASAEEVKRVSFEYNPGTETNIQYISDLCDAFGLPLPHPNETIPLRYANPHTHHKPGGTANIRIRHVFSDLFNYAAHYKHGFMDKFGRFIENPDDTLLDPEAVDFSFAKTEEGYWNDVAYAAETCNNEAKDMGLDNCAQKIVYCSGLAFSVGIGGEISAVGVSIGGGIDFGFGPSNDYNTR